MAPDGALAAGRYQLAVQAGEGAVGCEVQQGVVEGAAVRVAFVDPDRQPGLRGPGGLAHPVGRGGRDAHGFPGQRLVERAIGPGQGAPHPVRVGGHERLGEHDESGALRGGLLGELDDLLDRGVAVEEDGGGLDRGRDHDLRHFVPQATMSSHGPSNPSGPSKRDSSVWISCQASSRCAGASPS